MNGLGTRRLLLSRHPHTVRRIPHTLPALLAPLPALPLRHRTPCDARQGRRCELAHQLDAIDRPSTRRGHRGCSRRRSSSSSRNPVLAVRRRALRLCGREGYGRYGATAGATWWAGSDAGETFTATTFSVRYSASAAIPPCVVPVGNESVSCRSAVNQFDRQLFDRASANFRPKGGCRNRRKRLVKPSPGSSEREAALLS